MTLNHNSLHRKIYSVVYGSKTIVPKNLCPYFWSLVAALLFLLPALLINAITIVCESAYKFFRGKELPKWGNIKETGLMNERIGIFLAIIVAGLYLTAMLTFFWLWPELRTLAILGFCFVGGIPVVTGIVLFIQWICDLFPHNKKSRPKIRKPRKSILTEFIKAKYNNYCPKINWTISEPNAQASVATGDDR